MTLVLSPYHALLLLSDEKSLLAELPIDCSPALVRVIKTTSAVKNLQQLAQDADLALLQVGPGGLGLHAEQAAPGWWWRHQESRLLTMLHPRPSLRLTANA